MQAGRNVSLEGAGEEVKDCYLQHLKKTAARYETKGVAEED
jgi:hypothetical protein